MLQQFTGIANESGGTMRHKEVTVAEAPKHTDAGQAAISGCFYVNVAVTDIDGSGLGVQF